MIFCPRGTIQRQCGCQYGPVAHALTQEPEPRLAAVIELPGLAQQGQLHSLLLLRQHHPSNLMAFIAGMPAIAGEPRPTRHYDVSAVLAALDTFQSGQPAPWLRVMADATIAQHGYQFNCLRTLHSQVIKPKNKILLTHKE